MDLLQGDAPFRVFINCVDGFNSSKILKYIEDQLSTQEGLATIPIEDENKPLRDQSGTCPSRCCICKKTMGANSIKCGPKRYETVVTFSDKKLQSQTSYGTSVVAPSPTNNFDAFMEVINSCNIIVFDITINKKQLRIAKLTLRALMNTVGESVGNPDLKHICRVQKFIVITGHLTWACTPLKPGRTLTEFDFIKRLPHPAFLDQYIFENEAMVSGMKDPDIFKTYVITAGITYGHEEGILHKMFFFAYNTKLSLPVWMAGTNDVPLIHIDVLAWLVYRVISAVESSPGYFMAVEPTPTKLNDICKSVSSALGNALTHPIGPRTKGELMGLDLDIRLISNIPLRSKLAAKSEAFKNITPFCKNIRLIARQYLAGRGLSVLKIILLGPRGIGQTTVAKHLAATYKLVYLEVEDVIRHFEEETAKMVKDDELIYQQWMKSSNLDEDVGTEIHRRLDKHRALVRSLERARRKYDGRYPDKFVARMFRFRLIHYDVRKNGFIIDGWPKTRIQAQILFPELHVGAKHDNDNNKVESCLSDYEPEFIIQIQEPTPSAPVKETPTKEHKESCPVRRRKKARNSGPDEVFKFFSKAEIPCHKVQVGEDETVNEVIARVHDIVGCQHGESYDD